MLYKGYSPLHTGLYSREAYTILKMGLLLKSYQNAGNGKLKCTGKTDEHGRLTLMFSTSQGLTEYQAFGYPGLTGGNGRSDFIKRNPDGELVVMSKSRRHEEYLLAEFRKFLKKTIEGLGLRKDTLFWPSSSLADSEPLALDGYVDTMKKILGAMMFVRDDYYGNYFYEDIKYESLKPFSYQTAATVIECFLQNASYGEPESDQFIIEQRVLCYEAAKKFFDDLYVFIRQTSGDAVTLAINGYCKLKTGTYMLYNNTLRDLLCDADADAETIYAHLQIAGAEAGSLESLMDFKKFKEGFSAFKMKTAFSAVPNIIQLADLAVTFL